MGDLVERIWRGPFQGELPDGRKVDPGDAAMVTEADAESAWWEDPANPSAAAPDPEPEPEPPAPPPAPSFGGTFVDHTGEAD